MSKQASDFFTFKTTDGAEYKIRKEGLASVLDLKKKLEEVSGIKVDDQKITNQKNRKITASPNDSLQKAKILQGNTYSLLSTKSDQSIGSSIGASIKVEAKENPPSAVQTGKSEVKSVVQPQKSEPPAPKKQQVFTRPQPVKQEQPKLTRIFMQPKPSQVPAPKNSQIKQPPKRFKYQPQLQGLLSMGFDRQAAEIALDETSGNIQVALNMLTQDQSSSSSEDQRQQPTSNTNRSKLSNQELNRSQPTLIQVKLEAGEQELLYKNILKASYFTKEIDAIKKSKDPSNLDPLHALIKKLRDAGKQKNAYVLHKNLQRIRKQLLPIIAMNNQTIPEQPKKLPQIKKQGPKNDPEAEQIPDEPANQRLRPLRPEYKNIKPLTIEEQKTFIQNKLFLFDTLQSLNKKLKQLKGEDQYLKDTIQCINNLMSRKYQQGYSQKEIILASRASLNDHKQCLKYLLGELYQPFDIGELTEEDEMTYVQNLLEHQTIDDEFVEQFIQYPQSFNLFLRSISVTAPNICKVLIKHKKLAEAIIGQKKKENQ